MTTLWTLMVDNPCSKHVAVSVHASEDAAMEHLAEAYDPDGEYGDNLVQGLCDEGYVINFDEHNAPQPPPAVPARKTFTVIGAWADVAPLAFGAVEGQHAVAGDLDYRGFTPYAVLDETLPARVTVAGVPLRGGYWALQEKLLHALAALTPTKEELAEAAEKVWDAMLAAIRDAWDADDREEDDLDEIVAVEFGSDEWDNGWFPSGLTVWGRTGAQLDHLYDDEVPALADSEFSEELRALSGAAAEPGGSFEPRWSYRLTRPSSRPPAKPEGLENASAGDGEKPGNRATD